MKRARARGELAQDMKQAGERGQLAVEIKGDTQCIRERRRGEIHRKRVYWNLSKRDTETERRERPTVRGRDREPSRERDKESSSLSSEIKRTLLWRKRGRGEESYRGSSLSREIKRAILWRERERPEAS